MSKKHQNDVNRKKKFDEVKNIAQQVLTYNSNKTLGLERTMNGLGNPFRIKIRSKIPMKTVKKNRSEIAACEQKTTNEKTNFCSNTVFSLYFKIRAKKFKPQNHSLFRSISCFGVTKNHYSNLTSKIMKMCGQILKKDSAPIKFKFFEL